MHFTPGMCTRPSQLTPRGCSIENVNNLHLTNVHVSTACWIDRIGQANDQRCGLFQISIFVWHLQLAAVNRQPLIVNCGDPVASSSVNRYELRMYRRHRQLTETVFLGLYGPFFLVISHCQVQKGDRRIIILLWMDMNACQIVCYVNK